MQRSYFGVEVVREKLIDEVEIKKLPFYEFWLESALGSTMLNEGDKNYIYLSDWEAFAKMFIQTGKHRYQE